MPSKKPQIFPVVCIGASAGSLDAFKEFIHAVPPNAQIAVVIMQHQDPAFTTALPEILQGFTKSPVTMLEDEVSLKPGQFYIFPASREAVVSKGKILLKEHKNEHPQHSIDQFFTVFSEVYQAECCGILLSGMGSDGTIGLKKIKENGGVTMAQKPASAKFDAMPSNAIRAQVVDLVLDCKAMPARLLKIQDTLSDFSAAETAEMPRQAADEIAYKQILHVLEMRKAVDFSHYKQTTIRRRILRRMIITQVDELSKYLHFVEQNAKEQDVLYNDLLIPVTAFFRDEEIFDALRHKVFPQLFHEKQPDSPVRIWVAACSTGEEAYSIAMCLQEFLGETAAAAKVQVFATDISDKAIRKARLGIYSRKEIDRMSEERITRFFTKLHGAYHIKKNTRDLCVFATHNFLKDPPFAKIDFISCRNVLIYLEPYLQKKALHTFHYALNEKGILMLGKSETAGSAPELFKLLSKQEKLYSRKPAPGRMAGTLPERSGRRTPQPEAPGLPTKLRKEDFEKSADDIMLSKYVPAAVVVNEHFDIVQFRGATGDFLEGSPGKASLNILKMAREGLSFELRNALHKARETGETITRESIPLRNGKLLANIEVCPLLQTMEPHYLVIFKKFPPMQEASAIEKAGNKKGSSPEQLRIKQLEKDFAQLREDMRTVTEDLEAANEELQSANEELLSGSEELQSLNEELETSKEELQSTNEELITINQELYDRNEQYNQARQYAQAIVNTIREPLVVLNRDLRVKSANPAFYQKFRATEEEIAGKILFELQNSSWDIPELRTPLLNIQTGQLKQVEWEAEFAVPGQGKRILFLNALPVQAEAGEELILLAFKDITLQKKELQQLAQSAEALKQDLGLIENFFMGSPAMFCILRGPDHVFEFVNPRYLQVSGGEELTGKTFASAFPELQNQGYKTILDKVYETGEPFFGYEMFAAVSPGLDRKQNVYVDIACQPYRNTKNEIEGVMFFSYEVTKQVQAKKQLELDAATLEQMVADRTLMLSSANASLEKSNQDLKAFASVASHDLQEPLRKIQTFTGILRRKYAPLLPAEGESLLQKTETASMRMSQLIRDVLNYSKISAREEGFVNTHLGQVLQNLHEDFELVLAEKKGIISIPQNLPEIEAIPTQMNQLFYNLISNSLKFSAPHTTPVVNISFAEMSAAEKKDAGFNAREKYYRFEIADNGIGFEQQYAEQVFAIFERLHHAGTYEGTGIGLALCLRIVEQHRGRIFAQSTPGIGTRFTILLPARQSGTNIVQQS